MPKRAETKSLILVSLFPLSSFYKPINLSTLLGQIMANNSSYSYQSAQSKFSTNPDNFLFSLWRPVGSLQRKVCTVHMSIAARKKRPFVQPPLLLLPPPSTLLALIAKATCLRWKELACNWNVPLGLHQLKSNKVSLWKRFSDTHAIYIHIHGHQFICIHIYAFLPMYMYTYIRILI